MSQNAKTTPKPAQQVPEYVVAPRGTTVFEALNFERYVVNYILLVIQFFQGHLVYSSMFWAMTRHMLQEHACAAQQCPTPKMRMLGYIGTAAFMGFMGYMLYQREELTSQQKVERDYKPS